MSNTNITPMMIHSSTCIRFPIWHVFPKPPSLDGRPKVEKPRPAPADPTELDAWHQGSTYQPQVWCTKNQGKWAPQQMTPEFAVGGRYLQKMGLQ